LYARLPIVIDFYGYEVWQDEEKLYWYDSQPHPDEQSLQSTHPHHKHIPPGIKHHRLPAPEMSFTHPNLPALEQIPCWFTVLCGAVIPARFWRESIYPMNVTR
jgi:hypothetical protein